MATLVKGVFLFLVSIVALVYSIKDGAPVDPCSYPGIVAVIMPPDLVVCNGIRIGNTVTVPELCGTFINMVLPDFDVLVVYDDGKKNVTIPANSTQGTVTNGLYSITTPISMAPGCNGDAVLVVGSDTVDTSSCQVVGYGANSSDSKNYDGVLNAAPLIRSTSVPCCKIIYDSLSEDEKRGIPDTTVPLNCVSSSGSVCGMSDLGGPVYCNKVANGSKVVVGLTASTPCVSKGTFIVHDITGSNPAFKYGINP